ncbi:hypothetical protein WT98_01270 [Burkholderia territorii]|nr:hypothetical protein WT98_01270 [Burkholderia territorii]
MTVSNGGASTLTVTDNGTVHTGGYIIVGNNGTLGTANVDNGGTISTGGDFTVGNTGSGVVNVGAGGTVINGTAGGGTLNIGNQNGISGQVNVSGAGAAWHVDGSGAMVIGNSGIGALTISNGGVVDASANSTSYIGQAATGVGTVLVTSGAQWTMAGGLVVGNAGTASLTVSDGGSVIAPGGTVLASTGKGTLTIGSAAGSTPVAPGFIDTPTVTFGSGSGGRIILNHSDGSGSYAFAPVISGPGAVDAYSGTTVLTGAGSVYGGSTTVYGGTLAAGQANVFSPNSDYVVKTAGTLDLQGNDQTVQSLTNAGLVRLGPAGGTPGTQLTVTNYAGQGGTLAMNTRLGDDTSASDRLVINAGTASGTTNLLIANTGGPGAQTTNGIMVVQAAGGATTVPGAFTLGRPVEAGAYQYLLYRGVPGGNAADASNWYLRSTLQSTSPVQSGATAAPVPPEPVAPEPAPVAWRPGVVAYTMTPLLNLDYGFTMLGTLHQRVSDVPGAIKPQQNTATNGVWGRVNARSFDADTMGRFSTSSATYFAQFGKDWTLAQPKDGGSTHAGVTVTFGDTSATFNDSLRSLADLATQTGTVSTQAESLGGYWTRYLKDGTYFDTVGQLTYYHNRYGGQDGSAIQNGVGAVLSQEVGKPFQIGNTPVVIEPQAQLMYQYLSLGGFSDEVSPVSGTHTSALRGRVGFRIYGAELPNSDDHNPLSWAKPYLSFDVLHDFLRPGQTVVGETAFNPTLSRTRFDVGAGVTAAAGKHGELYAHGGYLRNLGGSYGQGFYGQLAYRYMW